MLGMRLSAQWTPGKVVLESDCARIVNSMQRKKDWSELGFMIAEAREHTMLLEEWRVAQVKRESNIIADTFSQFS